MFFIKLQKKINSSLSKQEVLQRLYEITNTNNKENDLFVGWIGNDDFEIREKLKDFVRNNFNPVLAGKIIEKDSNCEIDVTARLNIFGIIFLSIWSLGAIVFPLFLGLVEPLLLFIPLLFASFLTVRLLFAFYKPAKRNIALLNSILIK